MITTTPILLSHVLCSKYCSLHLKMEKFLYDALFSFCLVMEAKKALVMSHSIYLFQVKINNFQM